MKHMSFLKGTLAALVLVTVVSSGLAVAVNPFVDVPSEKFYAEPVDWAFNNGMTTGSPAGSTTFKPEDAVSRGENITFAKRYDDLVVQPALTDLQNAGMAETSSFDFDDSVAVDVTTLVEIDTLTIGGTGPVDVVFNAHVYLERSGGTESRYIVELVDGDCTGTMISRAWLRAAITASAFSGVTTSLTGMAEDMEGGSTVALCVRKQLAGSDAVSASHWSITAIWG